MRRLNPDAIHPPFAKYAHGIEVAPGARMVFCSGQLGISRDGAIPEDVEAQARLCFRAVAAILGEASMSLADLVRRTPTSFRLNIWAGHTKVRDEFVSNPLPASTLMIVQGFARPEFKIEIEAVAARAP